MTVQATFTHRPLTEPEARTLYALIKLTPNILGYTMYELLRFRDVWVAEVGGELAGVCIAIDMPLGWTEFAALCVADEFRGMGIGSELFDRAWKTSLERRRRIFVMSRHPSVLTMMRAHGMTIHKNPLFAPLSVQLYNTWHMSSRYRWKELIRKEPMRRADGLPTFEFGVYKP